VLVQRSYPVVQIALVSAPVELLPLKPVRVARLMRNLDDTGLLGETPLCLLTPVQFRGPALPIGPYAIDPVPVDDLLHLGDEQLVHVGAEDTDTVRVSATVGVHHRPLGMMLERHRVPHPGVMDEKPCVELPRHVPPNAEGILHYPRRCPPHVRGVPRVAGVPLAVVLHIVWVHTPQERADVLRAGLLPEHCVGRPRMQIEV